jgi:hypothetical protein
MAGDVNGGPPPSGSDKIKAAFDKKGVLEQTNFDWLKTISYGHLLHFWVRGQPEPDQFGGVVQIDTGKDGDFVSDVVKYWDPPFHLQFLSKGSTLVAFSWPHGQPGVEAIPDKV